MPRDQIAVCNEFAALALGAEAEVFEGYQHRDREAVVDRYVLDIRRLRAGFGECARAGPHPGAVGEIDPAAVRMLDGFAGAANAHQRPFQAARNLGRNHDDRAAAIADHAAIEPMQGICDHRRIHDIFDRDDVAQHRVRIVLRVMRRRDLDPGHLLGCRSELMHMAFGRRAIHRRDYGIERRLKRRVGRRHRRGPHHGLTGCARPPGQRDESDTAFAERDRFGGMADGQHVG